MPLHLLGFQPIHVRWIEALTGPIVLGITIPRKLQLVLTHGGQAIEREPVATFRHHLVATHRIRTLLKWQNALSLGYMRATSEFICRVFLWRRRHRLGGIDQRLNVAVPFWQRCRGKWKYLVQVRELETSLVMLECIPDFLVSSSTNLIDITDQILTTGQSKSTELQREFIRAFRTPQPHTVMKRPQSLSFRLIRITALLIES
ncbi:hypothetical protein C6P92_14410 [Burkholderia multivorans]|nr:hypothetical protein C6P92_14410 [Burkholderia multivorans]PRG47983.1 hypothetical protein C6T62_03220 [Burkholderia multivorans]